MAPRPKPLVVAITAAAGPLAYALLPQICAGYVFGAGQKLILHLLDVPASLDMLRALVMEIEDCSWPLLVGILATDNPVLCFRDADVIFLAGLSLSYRKMVQDQRIQQGNMFRTYREHATSINQVAPKHVKVMVISPPYDVNLMVCLRTITSIPKQNFIALNHFDRFLARDDIVLVWGGHGPDTTYIDPINLRHDVSQLSASQAKLKELAEEHDRHDIPNHTSKSRAVARQMSLWWSASSQPPQEPLTKALVTSLLVASDGSYETPVGLATLLPVVFTGDDKQYQIVPGHAPADGLAREAIRASNRALQYAFADACALLET